MRHRLRHLVRRAGWPGVLGLLMLVLMLLAFYQVVHWSVLQAQLRHASVAAQADARWRCRLDSGRLPCDRSGLAQLDASAGAVTRPRVTAAVD